MTIKKEIRTAEIRMAQPQDGAEKEMIVEGYAVRFNEPTVMWEYDGQQYYEVIDKNALNGADLSDVPFKYNHSDTVMVMARTRNKTLQLMIDEQGLFIRANLANTTAGRDLYELIRRGDIDKMSFAFTVDYENDGDSYNPETCTRTITKIKRLYDVAAVDLPAYDSTSISARSFFESENEKERKALENTELRKKLIIKTYL